MEVPKMPSTKTPSTAKALERLKLLQATMVKVQASTDTAAREVRDLRGMVAAELDGSDHPLLMELVNGWGRGEGMAGYMNEYQPLAWNIDVKSAKDFREHWRDVENAVETSSSRMAWSRGLFFADEPRNKKSSGHLARMRRSASGQVRRKHFHESFSLSTRDDEVSRT
jgi:hypothetical protein